MAPDGRQARVHAVSRLARSLLISGLGGSDDACSDDSPSLCAARLRVAGARTRGIGPAGAADSSGGSKRSLFCLHDRDRLRGRRRSECGDEPRRPKLHLDGGRSLSRGRDLPLWRLHDDQRLCRPDDSRRLCSQPLMCLVGDPGDRERPRTLPGRSGLFLWRLLLSARLLGGGDHLPVRPAARLPGEWRLSAGAVRLPVPAAGGRRERRRWNLYLRLPRVPARRGLPAV